MPKPLRATWFALQHRGRRGVLLRATLIYLACSLAVASAGIAVVFWVAGYAPLDALGAIWQGRDPGEPPGRMQPLNVLWVLPLALVLAFIYCVLTAAYEAACLRWLIRGERGDWFGDDAWRVYGVYWAWFGFGLLWCVAYAILSTLLSLLGAGNAGSLIALALLGPCILLSAAAFAPAAAATVATGRFAFLEATDVSDSHFSSLLGSYAVLIGGNWIISIGLTIGWWSWAIGASWIEFFVDARDFSAFVTAHEAAGEAAARYSGAVAAWTVSGVSLAASTAVNILMFGVNARAAIVAMEEGEISPAG